MGRSFPKNFGFFSGNFWVQTIKTFSLGVSLPPFGFLLGIVAGFSL